MAVKKKSMKGKGSYAAYANAGKREKNRNARLKRHLKNQPNDKQAAKALGKPLAPKKPSRNKVGQVEAEVRIYAGNGERLQLPSAARAARKAEKQGKQ